MGNDVRPFDDPVMFGADLLAIARSAVRRGDYKLAIPMLSSAEKYLGEKGRNEIMELRKRAYGIGIEKSAAEAEGTNGADREIALSRIEDYKKYLAALK